MSNNLSFLALNEIRNYPLYISRLYDKSKFEVGFKRFYQNLMQVFQYHEMDNICSKKARLRKGMETLIKLLHGNHVFKD